MIFALATLLVGLVILLIPAVLFMIYILLYSLFLGAPYAAVGSKRMNTMIKLAELKPGDKFADLGAGDGRLVIAAAQKGAVAHGYEINPILVLIAKRNIKQKKVSYAYIHWQSYWDVNLSSFDVVTIYGIAHIMKRIENKLKREGKRGARIVTNHFAFPTLKPTIEKDDVYLYVLR